MEAALKCINLRMHFIHAALVKVVANLHGVHQLLNILLLRCEVVPGDHYLNLLLLPGNLCMLIIVTY